VRPSSLQDHLASLETLRVVRTEPDSAEPGPVTRTYFAETDQLRTLLNNATRELLT
jgi:hypothetical protein